MKAAPLERTNEYGTNKKRPEAAFCLSLFLSFKATSAEDKRHAKRDFSLLPVQMGQLASIQQIHRSHKPKSGLGY